VYKKVQKHLFAIKFFRSCLIINQLVGI
jgi:hypothetical protein